MAQSFNLLTTDEAARQLRVSTDAVRRYWHSGILAGRRHGRILLVEQRAVLALIKVIDQARTGVKPTPPNPPAPRTPFDEVDDGKRTPFDDDEPRHEGALPAARHPDHAGDPTGL